MYTGPMNVYDDVIVTSSEILADVFHGCVGVAVADVDASSRGGSESSLAAVARKTLLQLRRFLVHLGKQNVGKGFR